MTIRSQRYDKPRDDRSKVLPEKVHKSRGKYRYLVEVCDLEGRPFGEPIRLVATDDEILVYARKVVDDLTFTRPGSVYFSEPKLAAGSVLVISDSDRSRMIRLTWP